MATKNNKLWWCVPAPGGRIKHILVDSNPTPIPTPQVTNGPPKH